MSVEAAFRSTDPDVLEVHRENVQRQLRWRENVQRLLEKYHADNFATWSTPQGERLTGAMLPDAHPDLPPEGWRWDQKIKAFKPAKRTPRGKEIDADLAANSLSRKSYPGMPWYLFTEHVDGRGYMLFLRVAEHDGAAWATFSMPPSTFDDSRNEVDESIWTLVPLSEYHLARERAEAPS